MTLEFVKNNTNNGIVFSDLTLRTRLAPIFLVALAGMLLLETLSTADSLNINSP